MKEELPETEELRYVVADSLRDPYEDRANPRINMADALRLGMAMMKVIIGVVDDQVGIRQAVEELHAGMED